MTMALEWGKPVYKAQQHMNNYAEKQSWLQLLSHKKKKKLLKITTIIQTFKQNG